MSAISLNPRRPAIAARIVRRRDRAVEAAQHRAGMTESLVIRMRRQIDLVARRAGQARDAGIDGLILSPHELVATRALVGPDMALVTPGVRPAGAAIGDQKRVMTPGEAIAAGADHMVVGRPVTQAADPRRAAEAIQAEIADACAARA